MMAQISSMSETMVALDMENRVVFCRVGIPRGYCPASRLNTNIIMMNCETVIIVLETHSSCP